MFIMIIFEHGPTMLAKLHTNERFVCGYTIACYNRVCMSSSDFAIAVFGCMCYSELINFDVKTLHSPLPSLLSCFHSLADLLIDTSVLLACVVSLRLCSTVLEGRCLATKLFLMGRWS